MSSSTIAFGVFGVVLSGFALFLLAGVVAIAAQGKPLDVPTTVVAVLLGVCGLLLLRAAWRRARGPSSTAR